ncbi:MAG: apolipoprotein N-acyltransferase [Chlorobiaceae bacterium]|jgi:apolipoprotein N-acyltransferase|nr:apolipoprotein N-acyltransferase [Chlorobiaceae bacterium]
MSDLSSKQKNRSFKTYSPALLSGILLGISFPTYPVIRLELLAWIAFVPLLVSLQHEDSIGRYYRKVYLSMLLFSSISLWWVSLATLPGGLLTIIAQSFFLTVPFLMFYVLKRRAGYRFALMTLPFIWVGWEWAYMQQDLSLGWLTLGNSQANLVGMIQYADTTGVWGISFWLLCFNVFALLVWVDFRKGLQPLRSVSALFMLIVLPLLYSWYVFSHDNDSASRNPSVRVTLVQPDIDPLEKWQKYDSAEMMELYYRLTDRAVRNERPELVIWPETAIPFYILDSTYVGYLHSLQMSLNIWNVSLLSGFSDIVHYPPGVRLPVSNSAKYDDVSGGYFETFNASMLLAPGFGLPQVYHKIRLVPFAERVPYVEYLPWLGNFTFSLAGISSWGKGSDTTLMQLDSSRHGKVVLGNIICYESIFPGLVSEFVLKGAQFLTLVTNDGWYSTSYGPYQHLAIGKLRCIENRRAMARCANTGITAFIDKYGRIYAEIPWWEENVLTSEVPLSRELTLFTRYPDMFPKVALAIAGMLIAIAFIRKIRAS